MGNYDTSMFFPKGMYDEDINFLWNEKVYIPLLQLNKAVKKV